MKDRKKTVIPKKKAIRKPKYIKYFALWLAIFLAVSMTASYFIIGVCRQQAKTKAVSRWNEYTQQLTRLMNDYCAANEDQRDVYFNRVRDFIFRYGSEMNEYCAVYVDNEKILETPRGDSAVIVMRFDSGDEETEDREEHQHPYAGEVVVEDGDSRRVGVSGLTDERRAGDAGGKQGKADDEPGGSPARQKVRSRTPALAVAQAPPDDESQVGDDDDNVNDADSGLLHNGHSFLITKIARIHHGFIHNVAKD